YGSHITEGLLFSLVIADPVGKRALTGLSMGERTGSRVLQWVWSYVMRITVQSY
ncbi:hypothetical protein LY78DRAFT_588279, partial [Colletotrichum sublineola]